MSEKKIAIYPGSFDPLTLGHLDIEGVLLDERLAGIGRRKDLHRDELQGFHQTSDRLWPTTAVSTSSCPWICPAMPRTDANSARPKSGLCSLKA